MYTSLLNVFSTPAELMKILSDPSAMIKNTKKGQDFFAKQYGVVDGKEVIKTAQSRQWFRGNSMFLYITFITLLIIQSELSSAKNPAPITMDEFREHLERAMSNPGPLDYLARGESIPEELLEYLLSFVFDLFISR